MSIPPWPGVAEQPLQPPVLEDPHEHAEHRGDREQVERDRLDRQHDRAGHQEEHEAASRRRGSRARTGGSRRGSTSGRRARRSRRRSSTGYGDGTARIWSTRRCPPFEFRPAFVPTSITHVSWPTSAGAATAGLPGSAPSRAARARTPCPGARRSADDRVGGRVQVRRELGVDDLVDLAAARRLRQHRGVEAGEADAGERHAEHEQQRGGRGGDHDGPPHHDVREPVPVSGRGRARGLRRRALEAAAARGCRPCRPSRASTAGRKTSATPAPISDTSIPPRPIERRKLCGKTSSEASAAATVSELKSTVRPAVRSVSRSAFAPGPVDGQLLPVARDDEEAPVDRQPEPEPGDEVERVDRERGHLARHAQAEQRARDGDEADERRQHRGDEAAEDQEREQEEERQRDQLGALHVGRDDLVHLLRDDRVAAEHDLRVVGERGPGAVGEAIAARRHDHERGAAVARDEPCREPADGSDHAPGAEALQLPNDARDLGRSGASSARRCGAGRSRAGSSPGSCRSRARAARRPSRSARPGRGRRRSTAGS